MPATLLDPESRTSETRATDGPPSETSPKTTGFWPSALLWVILVGPLFALAGAIVLASAAGVGLTWLNLAIAVGFFVVTSHGITIGFHRYFTHRSFTAKRPLRIALAIAGSMAIEGTVTSWVADHRRHHAHSDHVGDPHSPWRFGTSPRALVKGLWWAHVGWLFADVESNRSRFAPDLEADADLVRINRLFPLWAAISLLGPGVIGGLIGGTWTAALTAILWAGVVRMFLLHHITWTVNSLCHVIGKRPFASRDRSGNVWAMAIVSNGDSFHNLHHCEPTSARHGVDRFQLDSSARLIRWFELAGWATNVRWPKESRLEPRRVSPVDPRRLRASPR